MSIVNLLISDELQKKRAQKNRHAQLTQTLLYLTAMQGGEDMQSNLKGMKNDIEEAYGKDSYQNIEQMIMAGDYAKKIGFDMPAPTGYTEGGQPMSMGEPGDYQPPAAPAQHPRLQRKPTVSSIGPSGPTISFEKNVEEMTAAAGSLFLQHQAMGMDPQQNLFQIIQKLDYLPPQFLQYIPLNKEQKDSFVALSANALMKDGKFQQTTLQELVRERVIESMDFNKLSPQDRELVKKEVRNRAMLKAGKSLGHLSPEWQKYFSGTYGVEAEQAGQVAYQQAWGREAAESEAWRGMGPGERFKAKEELKTPVIPSEQVKGRSILKTYVGTMDTIRDMIDWKARTTPSKPGEFLWKIKDNFTNMPSGDRRRFRNVVARLPGLMYAMRGKQLSDKELEVALDMMPQMGFSDEAFINAFAAFEEYMLETEAAWTKELSEAGYREPRKEKYAPGSADEARLHQKLKAHGIDAGQLKPTHRVVGGKLTEIK